MNFASLLELHLRGDPGALALADSRCRFTFAELDAQVNRFATASLRAAGLSAGDRVAILLPNRVEGVIAILGSMKAGLVPVPLNWRLQGPDLAKVANHCSPSLIVTETSRRDEFDRFGDAVLLTEDQTRSGSFWRFVDSGAPDFRAIGRQMGDIANLMYTSGTTATPKAAIHPHGMRVAMASAMADAFQLSRRDIALAISPLFHTSGMSVFSNALFAGCPCILMEKWDLERFVHLIETEKVTFMHLISTLIVDIVSADPALFSRIGNSVRMTWGGGHSINPDLLEEFERRVGGTFVQGYARTEGGLCYNSIDKAQRGFVHHGFPNTNSSEIAIFDTATGLRCPDGDTGEIAVRGDGVSPGYWDGSFVRVPNTYDGGWQKTGDLGFIGPEGALRFLGRTDHMIKTGGENVYPTEVEAALLKIRGISDAAVFAVSDIRLGQKVAAVIVRSDEKLSEAKIDKEIRELLGGFKIPRVIAFVPELPKLGNQKIDLKMCRAIVERAREPTLTTQ